MKLFHEKTGCLLHKSILIILLFVNTQTENDGAAILMSSYFVMSVYKNHFFAFLLFLVFTVKQTTFNCINSISTFHPM